MGLEDRFLKIDPYVPGEQPREKGIIKINTNECAYPPSPAVQQVLESLTADDLRLYPDAEATELVRAISEVSGVPEEQIFTGIGSDDVLALAFLTFFSQGGTLLFPDVTYSFYPVWAALYGIPYRTVPTDENFKITVSDYTAGDAGGVIIANPNAPTAIAEPAAELEKIIKANPDAVVIIDEAYVDFGGESCLPLIDRYENLLVVQTGSKSRALAGLRVGIAFGSKKLIDALKAVKFSFNSYTMNTFTIKLAAAAYRDRAWFEENRRRIIATRERLIPALTELGFTCTPSATNFVFAKHSRFSGEEIFQALKARKIYVRHWNQKRIADWLRITVGTDEQADALIEALKDITGGGARSC